MFFLVKERLLECKLKISFQKALTARYIPAFFLSLILSSCGLFSKNDPSGPAALCSASGNSAGIESFKATIYPSLQQNCYTCHNSVSPKAPSAFADDSPSAAYPVAKPFADFSNPSNSYFVARMNEGHNCGSNCGALAASFTAAIATWAKAESGSSAGGTSCGGDPDDAKAVQTLAQSVPTSIGTTPVILTFDLGQATPPIPGAIFQVTATRFTPADSNGPGSYQLSNPTLAIGPQSGNASLNVRVSKINILFDGADNDSYRNWLATDFVLKPRKVVVQSPLNGWYSVNDSPQLLEWVNPAGDSVSFKLRISNTNDYITVPTNDPFTCKSLSTFQTFFNSTVLTVQPQSCVTCHNGANAKAYSAFPMTATGGAATCAEFKKRANALDPLTSLFYLEPANQLNNHPIKIIFSTTDTNNIKNWLNNEK